MVSVSPIFYFTSPKLGGYGFTPFQISIFIGTAGLSQALWLLFVFPPLQRRIGTGGVLRACAIAWPLFFLANPVGNIFLRHGWTAIFWTVQPTLLVIGSGVAMAFSKLGPEVVKLSLLSIIF
jgi:hypothetical protein